MADQPGFHHRGPYISSKIRSLLMALTNVPSDYDKITPKIEFWIEYVLRERFTTVDELVEGVSRVAWDEGGSYDGVARFLKEFRDAPHRSEQARSFMDSLCEHVLRWFTIASAEDLVSWDWGMVVKGGGNGLIRAASFVAHLIERGVLGHDLVRLHLVKPLIAHYPTGQNGAEFRANAIYQLFSTAGNTLLRGLLEPEDVQACFETLDVHIVVGKIKWIDTGLKLEELREIHTARLEQKTEEEKDATETEECKDEEDAVASKSPAEIETPIALVPQNLPTIATDTDFPSSALQGTKPPSILDDLGSSSETFVNIPSTVVSSPTLSISTISDLTPTELGENDGEGGGEGMPTRHETFYLEDGNVEIVCGHTIFKVHSPILSFSSRNLRGILSSSTLLNAPMPEGCPRVVFTDNPEGFAVLLEMIYTPGFPEKYKIPKFDIFASLLQMTKKYGFPHLRDQLVKHLRGAYPTKWEAYQTTGVLGEDIFGAPKPHPNAVLSVLSEHNVRFAIPFAAYRASLCGLSVLMSDEPGMVIPRRALASATHGYAEIRRVMAQAAHTIVYEENILRICSNSCTLSLGPKRMEERKGTLKKLYNAMIGEREAGVLSSPSLGGLACVECINRMKASHTVSCKACWDLFPAAFLVAKCWDEV